MVMSGDDDMMTSLSSRIEAYKGERVRLLVAQPIVPGQRLQVIAPPRVVEVLQRTELPLAMIGRYRHLNTHGVEVLVQSMAPRADGTFEVVLAGGRLCKVTELGMPLAVGSPWLGRNARVRFISPDDERDDAFVSSRVGARSAALEAAMDEWCDKVRRSGRQRFDGQLDRILADLGEMPAAQRPNERCLWVAGVINGLPPLGLANEVRAAVLMADGAERRLDAVEMAIADSIARLEVDWI